MSTRKLVNRAIDLCFFSIIYWSCYVIYHVNDFIAGTILLIYSFVYYFITYKKMRTLVDLRAVFLLTWCGTLGLAMWRILKYQSFKYSDYFFAVQFIGIITLLISIDLGHIVACRAGSTHNKIIYNFSEKKYDSRVYNIVLLCTFIAVICYIINYKIVGFIPLFDNRSNAYILNSSKFMTIEVGMAPIAGMAYYCSTMNGISRGRKSIMILCVLLNMIVFPSLNLSRGNMLANICMFIPAFVYCSPNVEKSIRNLLYIFFILLMILTSRRDFTAAYSYLGNTDNSYKTTLYMIYSNITCSHDNFALNIDSFDKFTHGLRMFNIFNEILDIPSVQNVLLNSKPLLVSPVINTHDMFGFFYYDLGIVGVFFWNILWGIIWGYTEKQYIKYPNPISCIVFGITFYCIAFAFFSSKTGFVIAMWYGMSFLCYMLMRIKFKKKK